MRIGQAKIDVVERKKLPSLLSLVLLLALAGCAHEQAYKKGMDLSNRGQYDKAVAELETAIRLAEDQRDRDAAARYRERLEEVKRTAGQSCYRQAQTRFEQTDLVAAQTSIERAIEYCPEEQSYQDLSGRIGSAIASAEAMRTEALSLAGQGQWQVAVDRMNEALRVHRTLPGGSGDLRQIQQRAYQHHLAAAQEKLRAGDLEGAESEAHSALSFVNDGKEAKALLRDTANRRESGVLIASGRSLLEQGDPEGALQALERANSLDPSQSELPALLSQARQAACERWIAQGRQAMDAGQNAAAFRLFQRSRDLLKGYGNIDALIADAKSRLATAHLDTSRQCLQSHASGCAAFHATVALGYRLGDVEAQRQLEQCVARVRQDILYTIEFIGFEAPPEHESIAVMLNSLALEHLSDIRPANARITDRIDRQVKQDRLGHTGVPTTAQASLMGQVLDCCVTSETRRTGEGESTYQDGFRRDRNPEHVKASAEVDEAASELERAKHKLAEAEAELARYEHADRRDREAMARKRKAEAATEEARQLMRNATTRLGVAQARLAATPREVRVPNMVHCRYPIQTTTWTANVTIMVKMVDAQTGELLLADRMEGRNDYSDRFVTGDPVRSVPEDPLVLPETERLLEAAAQSMAGQLERSLKTACDRHGQRFMVQMQRAETSGDTIRAADAGMKYLFTYPTGNADTGRIVRFLRTYLGEEEGLVDLQRLLQTYCRIAK